MPIHRRRSFVISVCAAVFLVYLFAPPAGAQAVEKKMLTVLCDNSCNVSLQTFTVPVGQTASQFQFSFETSWQPCQGVDRMDWIMFGLRGPMGNAVYECTEFWDRRPPRETPGPAAAVILGPGTYTVYLVSGRNTTVRMSYALTVGAKIPAGATEAKPVTVYRDGDCTLYPGGFRVEPGCTALGFRFSLDTSWLPCSGPEHVDDVTFIIRGPEGKDVYEYRAYYDRRTPQERLGSVNNLTLGPGNYVLLLGSGRSTTVKLNYVISCGPASQAQAAAPGYEPADLIATFETDFKAWYIKTGGTGNASVYRLGSDLQGKKAFTWDEITLLKPGRIRADYRDF